jgi:hypothetical protein
VETRWGEGIVLSKGELVMWMLMREYGVSDACRCARTRYNALWNRRIFVTDGCGHCVVAARVLDVGRIHKYKSNPYDSLVSFHFTSISRMKS